MLETGGRLKPPIRAFARRFSFQGLGWPGRHGLSSEQFCAFPRLRVKVFATGRPGAASLLGSLDVRVWPQVTYNYETDRLPRLLRRHRPGLCPRGRGFVISAGPCSRRAAGCSARAAECSAGSAAAVDPTAQSGQSCSVYANARSARAHGRRSSSGIGRFNPDAGAFAARHHLTAAQLDAGPVIRQERTPSLPTALC